RFIDRMSYQFHRQEMVAKPALIVVTTDGGGSKQVYKYLKMTLVGWGMDVVGNIQIAAPMYFENRTPKSAFGYYAYYHDQRHKHLTATTAKFSAKLNAHALKVPSFYDLFMFNCLRSKTYTSKVDRLFWEEKGWLDKNYFYDIKLNPLKKLFGSMMKQFIHLAGSRYLKNNAPSAVILSPEEYSRLAELEEDYALLLEATNRLAQTDASSTLPFEAVMANLGISEEDLDDAEDVISE
ncbi:MAG: hypothetical protein ACRDDX_15250, partial [Cellulosilyticaceae bacterium]